MNLKQYLILQKLIEASVRLVENVEANYNQWERDGRPLDTKDQGLALALHNRPGELFTQALEQAKPLARPALFALTTDQGTAAAETAICSLCLTDGPNLEYAKDMAGDDISDSDFIDCTENDALFCCICGLRPVNTTENGTIWKGND